MKIPLTDPIWSRLYGPYGVEDVNEILQGLQESWCDGVAKDLFWERLHHQDTLYPVTYAAIPWLVEIAPEGSIETYSFLSHVLVHSLRPQSDQDALAMHKYQGLSLDETKHVFDWLDTLLTSEDMKTLAMLEHWFSENCALIAQSCMDLAITAKIEDVGYLMAGPLAQCGGDNAAEALCLWTTGENADYAVEAFPAQSAAELIVAEEFATRVEKQLPEVAAFLRFWKECSEL